MKLPPIEEFLTWKPVTPAAPVTPSGAPHPLLQGVPLLPQSGKSAALPPALGGIRDNGGRHGPRGGQGPNSGVLRRPF